MFNNKSFDDWRSLKVGDIISVSDLQALQDSMKDKEGLTSQDYTIEEILHLKNDVSEMLFFDIAEENTVICVKNLDGLKMFALFEPDFFQSMTMEEIIDTELSFILDENKEELAESFSVTFGDGSELGFEQDTPGTLIFDDYVVCYYVSEDEEVPAAVTLEKIGGLVNLWFGNELTNEEVSVFKRS